MQSTQATCSIGGCGRKVIARGWCSKHYQRWSNHGDPLGGGPDLKPAIDHEDGSRTCTACNKRQPIDEFDIDVTASRGRRSQCKACRSEKMRAWYDRNQERQQDRARARRERDAEVIRARDSARYERDKPKRLALAVEHSHLRRAREAGVPIERGITVEKLREMHGDLCGYCGVEMSFEILTGGARNPRRATIEHILPLTRGGAHTLANTILCCWDCNARKKNRTVEEWDAEREALREDGATALDEAS